MRIAILSYGSLVLCPHSNITNHDIEVETPFKKMNQISLRVRLGMCAYGTKLTSCIDDKSGVDVQVYYAKSVHDNLQTAVNAFALIEGCQASYISIVNYQSGRHNHFERSVKQWLMSNNFDAALYANFKCTMSHHQATLRLKNSDFRAKTADYAFNRVPQPGGGRQWHQLTHRALCTHCNRKSDTAAF